MTPDEAIRLLKLEVPLGTFLSYAAQADDIVSDVGRRAIPNLYSRQDFGMALYPEFERALIRAGEENGLLSSRIRTNPEGGHYSLIETKTFRIGRHSGRHSGAIPSKRSKFRRELARLNCCVETQKDLFPRPENKVETVYLSILTVPDYRSASGCAHIGVGAFSPDFTRWIAYWSLRELVHIYSGEESVPDKAEAIVPDKVFVRLKKS